MGETDDEGFTTFTDREWLLFRILLVAVIALTFEKVVHAFQTGYF